MALHGVARRGTAQHGTKQLEEWQCTQQSISKILLLPRSRTAEPKSTAVLYVAVAVAATKFLIAMVGCWGQWRKCRDPIVPRDCTAYQTQLIPAQRNGWQESAPPACCPLQDWRNPNIALHPSLTTPPSPCAMKRRMDDETHHAMPDRMLQYRSHQS